MTTVGANHIERVRARAARQLLALSGGVLLVALCAQIAVPLPGTPVPVTLQVPAVLIVGGLLGPRLAAASLACYLLLGAVGLPVFSPLGVPGFARLIGPTGGYLLAFPVAAAIAGRFAYTSRGVGPLLLGLVLGVAVIHASGVAQLVVLGGDARTAIQLGSLPFWIGDIAKVLVAGLIIRRFASHSRALL